MSDQQGSLSTSPITARPKPVRTATTGTVRGRTSPGPGEQNGDTRPQKRARKAINCEPCRNSKLKCDRNRPCSSCVLRGTSAMCYQDGRGPDGNDNVPRTEDNLYTRIDPAQEIARLRHSISQLEAYVFPNRLNTSQHRRISDAAMRIPKKEPEDPDAYDKSAPAGVLQSPTQGGLYAGPTSAVTLMSGEARSDDADSRAESLERATPDFPTMTPEYDRDLLAMLPSLDIIDGLIAYYFDYCNWVYRHVNQVAFNTHWERFKSGSSADRLVLSTACAIMAVSTHYLPLHHHLLEGYHETHEALGAKFLEVSTMALQRRQSETKAYNLDLVELLLLRVHYLTLLKRDTEEIWAGAGELVTIGTAMGLHRDPGKFRMHRDVAERRRWAWWHIILLERWQAFMLGRPLGIATRHFDTQLPSHCDPSIDKSGRLYLPNIALFRLAYILGDIVDDALCTRSVPYENIMSNDRALTQWMDNLPPELDLDEFRVARNLASNNNSLRRLGVQSVIIRTSYYHIRFTLHRPYATSISLSGVSGKTSVPDPPKAAQSLEIAVGAADKLITMVAQSRPDFHTNVAQSVPGHMNWGPFHCFTAAMFFSFQLVFNPEQPGAGLFRSSIRKAISTLELTRGMTVSDKALDILTALSPLCSQEFPQLSLEEREKKRAGVLSTVRKLAFPYQNSNDPRRFVDSPRGSAGSPANSNSLSPPLTMISAPSYDLQSHAMSSVRTPTMYQATPPALQHVQHPGTSHSPQQLPPSITSSLVESPTNYVTPPYSQPQSTHGFNENQGKFSNQFMFPVDDASMWGAAIGFEHSEWTQFLDNLRPENPTPSLHRHMAGS